MPSDVECELQRLEVDLKQVESKWARVDLLVAGGLGPGGSEAGR